jgi:thioredoxin reductase (NADPH)
MIEILIIGSGPAGYTAAIYASRAGRKVKLIEGPNRGGQLMITSFIENYPGFSTPITGPELMENIRKQTESFGVEIICDSVKSVDFSNNTMKCVGESGKIYESKSIIIATGAAAKWLNVPGEKEYMGKGVSGCATCDGFFFKNKDVAVIGGGNTAVEEAIFLTNFAKSVTLIHRSDSLKAEKIMQDRLMENKKINILWNTTVTNIFGNENKATGMSLLNVNDNTNSNMDIDGVFVAIGHQAATSLFQGKLNLDNNGYIVTQKPHTNTSVKGVFAAGDVSDPHYRQAIVSAAQGCMAAIDADRYLTDLESI